MNHGNSVKVIVHRGSHQIGGCCTEIATNTTRILIDFGSNLDSENDSRLSVDGVNSSNNPCDAILISHYHGDHIGELIYKKTSTPIYMTKKATQIQMLYQKHANGKYMAAMDFSKIRNMEPGIPFTIGNISILPIESDHSAFEPLMFLIEANGKRILHTGDFRLHGYQREKLLSTLSQLHELDLVITEGTTLSRKKEKGWTEAIVQQHFAKILKEYKYCFFLGSSSNTSRLETLARSVPQGKYFLVDSFQKNVLSIINHSIFEKVKEYGENLKLEKCGFVYVIRANKNFKAIIEKYISSFPDDTCLIYSMWSGYLESNAINEIYHMRFKERFIVHSSGHVVLEDLNMLLNMLNPRKIIIIHTEQQAFNIDLRDRLISIRDQEVLIL